MSSSLPSPIPRRSTTTAVPLASCSLPLSRFSSRLLGASRVLRSFSEAIERSRDAVLGTREAMVEGSEVEKASGRARLIERLPSAMPVAWRV